VSADGGTKIEGPDGLAVRAFFVIHWRGFMDRTPSRPPTLYSYVVKTDVGFAPNPFGSHCTLAACTPNHQGVKAKPGDWIMGNSDKAHGQRLVHAMRVSEVLEFDDYFHDPRFAAKKARPRGDWRNRCGDNIYHLDENGKYKQAFTYHHVGPEQLEKDIRRPRVFISDHFFYFGENAPDIPAEFGSLIRDRQGCRKTHDPEVVRGFIAWLERTYRPGMLGLPRDREADDSRDCETRPRPQPDRPARAPRAEANRPDCRDTC